MIGNRSILTRMARHMAPRWAGDRTVNGGADSSQPAADAPPGHDVWIDGSDGIRLHAWFVPVGRLAPAVIVIHGWGGSAVAMLPLAPHIHRMGFHGLFLDVRNHGLSDRDRFVSMPRFADDLDTATAWTRGRSDVTSVGVIGHSVGAGAAILSASRSEAFDALVSVAAPADPERLMREQMSSLPEPLVAAALAGIQRIIGQGFADFAPHSRLPLVSTPVLLVHGGDDRIVPVSSLHALSAAQPAAEVLLVPGGGHADLRQFLDHIDRIDEFLGRQLRPDSPHSDTGIVGDDA